MRNGLIGILHAAERFAEVIGSADVVGIERKRRATGLGGFGGAIEREQRAGERMGPSSGSLRSR